MVEVWLPYGDTEIPVMLPDPINLKIMPKTIYPQSKEKDSLEKLRNILKEYTPIKLVLSPIADDAEINYITGVLRRLGLEYEVTNEFDESNVAIDIFRYDPILEFRTSLWFKNLFDDVMEFLRKSIYSKPKTPYGGKGNRLYVDLVLDGGARLYDVYASTDGSHFNGVVKVYTEGWCLKTEPSPLIIASMGGLPWDTSLYLFLIGLSKLTNVAERGSTVIAVSKSKVKDVDPTVLKDLKVGDAEDPHYLYIAYCKEKISNLNIVHYGSIPRSIASLLNMSKTLSVEKYLGRIPISKKRDILVIEDLYLFYPSLCIMEESEEEA